MEKINNFISRLAPGSIAVVVNDREKFEHFRTLNSGARTFHITQETDPVGTIMTELFGNSSTKQCGLHLHFDLIFCGKETTWEMFNQLKKFIHPGGITVYKGTEEVFIPASPKDIRFAKLTDEDKNYLWQKVSEIPDNGIYVEIGSYKGGSALLAAAANPRIRIYCVDIWQQDGDKLVFTSFDTWERHAQYYPNIIPVRVDPANLEAGPLKIAELENIPLEQLKFDLLYVDGDHSYNGVMTDLNIYEKYADNICGHDFHVRGEVPMAVYEYYSTGWKQMLNRIYNKLYKFKYIQRLLRLIRRDLMDRLFFRPKQIGHMHYKKDHSSIWFTTNK